MAKSYGTRKRVHFRRKTKILREMEELEESGLIDLLSNRQRLYSKMDIILKVMIFDYISQYETHKTLETAIALCQFLLDTDQTTTHEGRKYKTLCNYLLLEGCLYDVGAWDRYMELES